MNQLRSGKLAKYGFEELFSQSDRDPNEDPAKYWTDIFVDSNGHNTVGENYIGEQRFSLI
jgi:hypothetical protein